MATTMIRTQRQATPARWQAALRRALAEGVQVRQVVGSGLWVATSGTDAAKAYAVAVSGDVAHGCDCPAGLNDDPVCKHRALWWHLAGLLDPDPEPPAAAAPAPAPTPIRPALCACDGRGYLVKPSTLVADQTYRVTCRTCRGSGFAPVALPAAA